MKTKLLVLGALFALLCASVQGAAPTPVLHLSFDNVSGTNVINDGSGGSAMDGALYGAGATIVGGGMFGNCLQVLGANSSDVSCRITNAVVPLSVSNGTAWTVACWIKTSTRGATWMYQGDGGWAANNTTFFTALNNGSTGNASDAAGGVRYGQGWQQGTTTVDNGVWHHIVFTFDGTTKLEYVDGVLETWVQNGWAVGTGDTGVGAQFWIGGAGNGQGDGQVCLNGLIDEAYVFDVALSASDVNKLYANNSLTISPVPVAVTVSPKSGLRGTVVTVTATATPAGGATVTNATVNLSGLGLSNSVPLVQSSLNVFTNSFTVPTNAAIGLANVIVTVKDTTPIVGSGATNFFVLAVPPTNATVVTELTSKSAYQYTEVSFHFAATNDAPNGTNDTRFPMTYAWYTNGVRVSTNPMGPYYTFLTTPDQNNLPIQCIARVNDDTNYYSYLTVTSALVHLTVTAGTPVYTNGLKEEVFSGVTSRADVEIGNTPPGVISLVSSADTGSAGGFYGNNTSRRYSGYFIPPADGAYVFFLAADDDTDLFLSTNSDPRNKQLIAREDGYSGTRSWITVGGNGSITNQKRSDTFTNSVGVTPYPDGIPLLGGLKYYIESVEHNGTGGDNWAVTYVTVLESYAGLPVDGSASRLTTASNNIAVITWPGTTPSWVADLTPTNVSILEGNSTNFTAVATSDAEMTPAYQWYIAGAPYPGATGTNFLLSSIPTNYNNAQIYVVASNQEGGLSITSRVATLHVISAVHEVGFVKDERYDGYVVSDIVNNRVPSTANFQVALPEWGATQDNSSAHGNFVRRISGYFIPPSTGSYNFHLTSDDDSILFLSTDETPGHKTEVARQNGWNAGARWDWGVIGGGVTDNAGEVLLTHSETWSPTLNGAKAYTNGILLNGGQRYYIEQDMHQGGGGANMAATYSVFGDADPAVGTETLFKGSTIQMSVPRCTYVAFTQQPQNVTNAALGSMVGFSATGTTDSQITVGGINGYEEDYVGKYLFFQWFTNGVAVPGANSGLYLLGPVTAGMIGMPVMCQTRALGFTDDALNPIWTNSTSAHILNTVAAAGPSLRGHWISGAASLADTANVVGPGVYDALTNRVTTGTRYLRFTNDVPPGATAGAQSLYFNNNGLIITNTGTGDPGYMVDTFDGGLQNGFTIMLWAKGTPGGWNPWVSKAGDNNTGWQLRVNNGSNPCWTFRGDGAPAADMATTNTTPTDGQWHHYAGTWDGTTFIRNLYVDGVLGATETGTQLYTLPSPSHLMIGARDAGGASFSSWFTGRIYDVRIYNYELTQSQIIQDGKVLPKFTGGNVAITTGPSGPQFVLTYSMGTLLSSTNVAGPWTAVPGATSPYTNILDSATPNLFFSLSYP
jgi:hypothetical protein